MKLFAIYITNNPTAYGGAQPLRQAVLFVFIPDGNGMRFRKVVNNATTEYYYNGDQLIMESRNGLRIYYIYGETGIEGLIYGSNTRGIAYSFDKNTLGDIVAIRDEDGNVVATYEYDAWGNVTVYDEWGDENTNSSFIGNINPIRYRGYYYDTETGFYYLQTWYYDPSICRFINADNYELVAELSQTVGQLNLYAYCSNNPIMYTDPTGEIAGWLLALIGVVASGVISGVVGVMTKNETESAWGAFAGGFVTGAVSAVGLAAGLATGGVGGAALAILGGGVGGILGSATGQKISYGVVDKNVAYLNGGINALTTGFSYFGLALTGLYTGGSWMSRFMDAAAISEVGVGVSVFFATQNLPNPNDYRGRLNYFGR